MSPTMILVLTAMVTCGFGHPLQPAHKSVESSNYLNKSWGNLFSSTSNYTNVSHNMNMSQTIKNKMDGFQVGGDSPSQTAENNTDAVSSSIPRSLNNSTIQRFAVSFACDLSLCAVSNLAHSLNSAGDQVAEFDTKDPLSPGK
ncbi:hypothetical protein NL108_000781 [Boleophthalmus pectinirostris]|uniref:uncharacterized protein zgc:193726 isoform X1 n=1 Tax=Boleophthalmus pectinirostris TaxID=150288 RepID=UPI00242B44A7|nr:uncharacterized protein zgc:193726 isoform X1 [Boleophthalmus pectinirostris]KAJ0047493.1 hypothetical protein NL108_000781 [Boleophthalmus pectinirostris]